MIVGIESVFVFVGYRWAYKVYKQFVIILICKYLRRLSIVEGEGYLELTEIAVPEYTVPSKQIITRLFELTA